MWIFNTRPVAGAKATPAPAQRWVLASLALGMLLPALGTSIANVALPSLARTFAAPLQQVQWVVLAYLLATTACVVGAGRLGDLVGHKRLLMGGVLLFTAASALAGLAPSLGLLVAARVAQGLGAAAMMALTLGFVADVVPKAATGRAMGLLGTMSAVGTALGPTLGGGLIASLGWPAIFFVNLPLGALALVLVRRHLPADPPAPKTGRVRFDHAGTAVLALSLAAYALAMTLGRGHLGGLNLALLLAAAVGAGVFVRIERRAAAPLLRLAMFRDPQLGAGFAMSALVTTVVMATLVVGPFYLAGALGLDAGRVGLVMSCGPLAAALAGVPAGRLVDRLGAHRMGIAGLVGMAAGAALLPLLPVGWGIPGYVGPMVVITAGYALFQAANNTAVMANIAPDQRGAVSGVLNLSRNLGLITGASVMGAVFASAAALPGAELTAPGAVVAGLRATLAVAVALVLVALAIAAWSRTQTRRAIRQHRGQGEAHASA